MPIYSIIIRYESLDAFREHGRRIEQIATDGLAEKGATNQTVFISTRSFPPIHTTSFVVPDTVTTEDLKKVAFPDGVVVYFYQEP